MSQEIYYLIPNGGNGYSPDGTLPNGAVICSFLQYQNATKYAIENEQIVEAPIPILSLAEQAAMALTSGLTITSTDTPAVNGLYDVSDAAQTRLTKVQAYISRNSKFPGSSPTLTWPLLSGGPVVIPSIAVFEEIATAIANYVWDLDEIILSNSGAIPASSITIT